MPDNAPTEKRSPVFKEGRARRNWWYKAKRFVIRDTGMYDMGDNANLNISENHISAGVVVIMDHLASSISRVDTTKGGEREPDQLRVPPAQDSNSSGDEAPEIAAVQGLPTPETNTAPSMLPSMITFTSEAMAFYADPDVPLDNPTTYSCTSRARAHIYSLGMLTHRAGYPIYMPTPFWGLPVAYRKKGIRIGDVGTLTADGAFDFLFNICQSEAGNPTELPDGFELLKPSVRSYRKFASGTCLTSDHVSHVVQGGNRDWSPEFQCSAAEGAALVLPTGATFYQAMNRIHFRNRASRHAINWYRYMLHNGRDSANGSLYLVTECTKSIKWGISVFYAPPTANNSLRFIFNEGLCQWESRGKVEAKAGPEPKDIIVTDDEEPNQCVFLRGYKIMLRQDVWDKLRSAVDVTSEDGEFSASSSARAMSHSTNQLWGSQINSLHRNISDNGNNSGPSHGMTSKVNLLVHSEASELLGAATNVGGTSRHWSQLGEVILEDNFIDEAPLHPSDLINLMLLRLKREARVALVHDNEWCKHLPHDFIADPVNPNVDDLLENVKRSRKAVIDEHGSVVLVNIDESTASDFDPSAALVSLPSDLNAHFQTAMSTAKPVVGNAKYREALSREVPIVHVIRRESEQMKEEGDKEEEILAVHVQPGELTKKSDKEEDVPLQQLTSRPEIKEGEESDKEEDAPLQQLVPRPELKTEEEENNNEEDVPAQHEKSKKGKERSDKKKFPFLANPYFTSSRRLESSLSMQLDSDDPHLSSLLFILRRKPTASVKSVVNRETIELTRKLLSGKDYMHVASQLDDKADVKLLLDFMLYLLRNGHFSSFDARLDANRRARRFMIKVIKMTPVIPTSLLMTGVSIPARHESDGGFGLVFKGKLGRKTVALKVLHKTHNDVDFCRQALMWRSLNHQFVLPFLGICGAELASPLLVSPYMENGTLSQWRSKADRTAAEIERLILEVAQGVEYIHSEGVVHGDLRGDNVLLDANFHVQIADFGLTRHSESAHSGAIDYNFTIPKLFEPLPIGDSSLDDSTDITQGSSDVYDFGCLYYEIQYGSDEFKTIGSMSGEQRPPRLDEPPLSNEAWELIRWCWTKHAAVRPSIERVRKIMMSWKRRGVTFSRDSEAFDHRTTSPPEKISVTDIWQRMKSTSKIPFTRSRTAISHDASLIHEPSDSTSSFRRQLYSELSLPSAPSQPDATNDDSLTHEPRAVELSDSTSSFGRQFYSQPTAQLQPYGALDNVVSWTHGPRSVELSDSTPSFGRQFYSSLGGAREEKRREPNYGLPEVEELTSMDRRGEYM